MSDNLKLWNSVCKTDPNHTKKVNQRGGFTAIDAHYQVQCATKAFGPIGEGWGFETSTPIFQNTMIVVPVYVWHGKRENSFGPILGCAEMFGNRPDADAPKKATTDGITKALSMLGFNADVFLGKFDDNKYVNQMKKEFSEPHMTREEAVAKIQGAKSLPDLKEAWEQIPVVLRDEELVAMKNDAKNDFTNNQ
jgi:uncharacterized short protein YbdD (DUF466 family)